MHRLKPENIVSFHHLLGCEVTSVSVGQFQLSFSLHPDSIISVEEKCVLLDFENNPIDVWDEGRRTDHFCAFIDLLGATVAEVSVENAVTLRLRFVDGRRLLLLAESEQYESFSVDGAVI